MQLILKPVSDTRLQEIIVTDSRFAIGRNEEQFRNYDRAIVQKLSRQHARIFEHEGRVYIADLCSSNGTTVNGQNVEGEPRQLQLQDELEFGGLRYRVEHLVGGEEDVATVHNDTTTEARVILQPISSEAGLAPIVLSGFPYLVGRHANVFASQRESNEQQLAQVSKKHAHFFLQNGAVHIEDLGSTNGTFVSGERLAEHSRQLANGDTVAFGGNHFLYEVQTIVGSETLASAEPSVVEQREGTIFVNDATNFFEIYQMRVGDDDASDDADAVASDKPPAGGPRLRFLRSVRDLIRGSAPVDRRLRWTFSLGVIAVAIGVAGYWYYEWPVQQTTWLLEDEEYRDAAMLANRHLSRRPGDERLRALATESVLKLFIPLWLDQVSEPDESAAGTILSAARALGSNNPDDDAIFDALEMAERVMAVDVDAAREAISIDVMADDGSASMLLREWEAWQRENAASLLSQVDLYVDGFLAFRTELQSRIRLLSKRETDIKPLIDLRTSLEDALLASGTGGKIGAVREIIEAFSNRYQDTQGLDQLDEDRNLFEAVELALDEERWMTAVQLLSDGSFHTPPFVTYADYLRSEILPNSETIERYELVFVVWNEPGQAGISLEMLEELANQPGGSDARNLLDRNRRLLQSYDELAETDPDTLEFEERLFDLFLQLDAEDDRRMFEELQPLFDRHRDAALARADRARIAAESAWTEYEELGNLTSVHRFEDWLSPGYEALAGKLMAAHELLGEGASTYERLDAEIPSEWIDLNRRVVTEIRQQIDLIEDYRELIGQDITDEKLKRLPALAGS